MLHELQGWLPFTTSICKFANSLRWESTHGSVLTGSSVVSVLYAAFLRYSVVDKPDADVRWAAVPIKIVSSCRSFCTKCIMAGMERIYTKVNELY